MPNEGRVFAEYLALKALYVDVWDADSRLHVGTCCVPLDKLLRQRSPVAKLAAEHAVVAPFGLVDEGSYGTMNENFATPASIVCCNYGEEGKGSLTTKKADDERPLKDALGRSLDWRKASSNRGGSKDLATIYGGSNPELGALLESRDRRGGLFAEARGRSARDGPAVSADSNAVTYDEVLMMVRRFRDDRGRVQYRGPLLSLLEAPNLKALEAQLIRVLTKAEAKGTTLERAFAYFDQDHGGTISVVELEDALRALGCFRGANSGGVVLLLKRFDENGDGVISLDEFLAFVRQRQREYKERKGLLERKPVANEAALLEARVKAIFLKAEELGVSVVDAFNEFDADGNGQLTVGEFGDALRSLGTFSDLKPREVKAFFDHRDRDGNGTLELEELFALMGRDYADHLVLKLSRILDGVERKGTMIADCFAAWDADGGGSLSRGELTRGLRSLGIFNHMKPRDVEKLLDKLDDDKSGDIDIKEFYLFAKRDYGAFVEARVRAVLRVAEAKHGVPLDAAFREWDKDGGRSISLDELRRGLDELGVFKGVDEGDIKKLLKKLDDDDSGEINMAEFLGFAGCDYSAVLARRLRAILLNAEERGTTLEAAFAEWDKDGGGTIDHAELKAGLKALGTFADMSGDGRDDQADVDKLVRYFDRDGDGSISVRELLRFMGRDPISSIEAKLRQIVHASGIGADEAFKHFDKDGDGSITRDELAEGLRELPGLEDITNAEAAALAKLYDANGDDEIQLDEFTRQLGASAAVGDAERLVLGALRAAVLKLRARPRAAARSRTRSSAARARAARVVDDAALERQAFGRVGVEGAVDAATRKLLLGRFDAGGGASVGALVKFAKRGGVGTPDEIARDLGEPSASPTEASTRPPDAAAALEDPACAKLAELLLTFEASGADLAVAFKKLDPDGSGDIEAVELFEGLRGLGDAFADFTLADARRVVKALDADRSNSIDLTELRAFALAARHAKDEPDEDPKSPTGDGAQDKVGDLFLAFQDGGGDLRDAFARLDADGSGSIDAGELYEGLKGLGPVFDDLTRDDAKRLVRVIDTDGNGGVELREIEDFAREFRAKKTGGRPAAEKRGDRIDETAKTLRAVLAKAARSGAKLKDAFAAFDRDGSGKLSARELHKALKHVGGDDLFRDVTRKDVEALVRREFDDDGDAEVDIGEFVAFATKPIDDAPRTPGGRRESAELVREKLRAILLRTEQMGTSLKSVFRALDDDGSGALSVKELLRGLRKLGVFQELDADDVEKLVRSDLDRDGNDAVELDEFLAFCRDAPGTGGNVVDDEDADLEIVSRNYEFSLDPDTRCVEKKLRRAARELAGRGGDVRLLLDQYDVEGVGSVIRSDFVQVLMQLGLSLVDGGGPPRGDVDDAPTRADALRERQLAQLARVRGGGPGPANARRLLRTRQSRGDDDDARLVDEWDDLKMVEWYREGSKRDMVRGMLAKSMLVTVPIYPTFGTTAWFEVEIHNPFSRAERFTVDISAKERELRLVTSSEEWAHLRRHVPAAFGTTGEGAVEADMIDASGPPGSPPVVLLMAHETIRVPFAFLTLEPPSHELKWGAPKHRDRGESKEESKDASEDPARVVPVRFVAAGGYVVAAVEVEARPRACVVDRTFRFYQSEGEILKRCVRVLPPAPAPLDNEAAVGGWAAALAAPPDRDGRSMYVSTGRGDASDVSIQWREAPDCPGAHEVLLKYARVGAFPSVGEFYVLVFRDRFCAKLAELWHCVVHSRLRADLNGVAGQAAGVELVVRGDRTPRVVKAYAAVAGGAGGSTGDATFDPPDEFRLVPHAHNKFAVHYRARDAGAKRVHVHLVDADTKELVAAWLLTAVELPIGKAITKRIPYRNPWNKPKSFALVSSDESILRPRDGAGKITIPPNGVDYLRLYFPAVERRGMMQCFLYVNSEFDQSEEVFLLRLLVA
ncbi:hypothetical protein SO694_00027156 [Aureococcus anophagefferens]|uniref:EF-hand domain-containing protein n=1 Tax=Aureococcus anophagefferens TaxID=44056 RepID=A0ABR1FV28_AURAN